MPRKAQTFHACSSPAPTQIKPQLAPAILGQEFHTMLSITHHSQERPSTSPRMLWSSISLLMSALTTHTSNQFREKRKRKETKEKLKQVIKSQTKAKKRLLEREKYRSPKAWATTRHNRDKMLQNCRLHKVRQKGSTPSAKEHN
jgi:hypothetical protein